MLYSLPLDSIIESQAQPNELSEPICLKIVIEFRTSHYLNSSKN